MLKTALLYRMSENIEFLERKCEELSGTLESIRDVSKKQYMNGKFPGTYFGFGGSSESSEDDGQSYTHYPPIRRSQSLHDLRYADADA